MYFTRFTVNVTLPWLPCVTAVTLSVSPYGGEAVVRHT